MDQKGVSPMFLIAPSVLALSLPWSRSSVLITYHRF